MTELREMPPSSAAIWEADNPSLHSFLRTSTRSSVQFMALPSLAPVRPLGRIPAHPPDSPKPPSATRCRKKQKTVPSPHEMSYRASKNATIWRDSRARVATRCRPHLRSCWGLNGPVIHNRYQDRAGRNHVAWRRRRSKARGEHARGSLTDGSPAIHCTSCRPERRHILFYAPPKPTLPAGEEGLGGNAYPSTLRPSPVVNSHLLPTYARVDLAFERGEGPWLFTTEGERYLDFTAGVAVNRLGHAHPHLLTALAAQAPKFSTVTHRFTLT